MTEVSERYGSVAACFTSRLDNVPLGSWSAPTPCPDWTVRDLAAHVVMTHRRVLARLDGIEAADLVPDDDLGCEWRVASAAVLEALDDPARASRVMGGMFGDQPFADLVGRLVCTDTLVHTWDLARATGQDERLPADAVAKAAVFLASLGDAIRRAGGFGARIEPSPHADEQTRFLNLCGRAV